jgi:hypothetical protein
MVERTQLVSPTAPVLREAVLKDFVGEPQWECGPPRRADEHPACGEVGVLEAERDVEVGYGK